jgi:hypothetical protein
MEEKIMRKATICFLLLLCSVIAFGQQPQWTTVASVVLFSQNQNVPKTTIFTPTEPGVYRLNVYFSGGTHGAATNGAFEASVSGFDITGRPLSDDNGWGGLGTLNVHCGGFLQWGFLPQLTVSLEPNVPLVYQVLSQSASLDCVYNLAITVEQLVQQ